MQYIAGTHHAQSLQCRACLVAQAPFSKPLRTKPRRGRRGCLPVPAVGVLLGIGLFAILG